MYESQYAAPVVTDNENNDNEDSDDDLFSHIYKKCWLSNNENELDLYLRTPIIPGKVNLLQW